MSIAPDLVFRLQPPIQPLLLGEPLSLERYRDVKQEDLMNNILLGPLRSLGYAKQKDWKTPPSPTSLCQTTLINRREKEEIKARRLFPREEISSHPILQYDGRTRKETRRP